MHPPIYLDHAAAAPVLPAALDAYTAALREHFANQEALHGAARQVRAAIAEAAVSLTALIGVDSASADVYWGDSGSTVLAALLSHPQWRQGTVVTTAAEHPALTAALRRHGLKTRLVNLRQGLIDLDHLASLLGPDTALVAIHHVQSETGIRQDLTAIGKIVRQVAPKAYFLSDTIQSAGKLPLLWKEAGLDLALVSGCKIGAPGGATAVCRRRDGKEFTSGLAGLRRDDHAVSRPHAATCLALVAALREMTTAQKDNFDRVSDLNRLFRSVLDNDFPVPVRYLQTPSEVSPYILHFLLPGYQAAVLVRMLTAQQIYLAAGSACNAETNQPSPALTASGVGRQDAFSGLRVSFGVGTTVDEVKLAAAALREAVKNY